MAERRPTGLPTILVTDIGGDIDDTWALALLLKSPELNLKLAVTDYGNPLYRTKVLAKFLQTTGHGNIAVGMGPSYNDDAENNDGALHRQADWIEDYELDHYPGPVHENGARAIVEVIMTSKHPVTLISIGPAPTVAEALSIEPRIAAHARFVGMYGSIRVGYDGFPSPVPEGNVVRAVKPAQKVLSAPWKITITPLDTCGLVTLEGARYQRLVRSDDSVVTALIENYRIWCRHTEAYSTAAQTRSSVLFDTVAVYLALAQGLCTIDQLHVQVTDDGFTRVNPKGRVMDVATAWRDLEAYKDWLVTRLLSNP
jgi:inosine-uridine nucleoside N-ribohydrolase